MSYYPYKLHHRWGRGEGSNINPAEKNNKADTQNSAVKRQSKSEKKKQKKCVNCVWSTHVVGEKYFCPFAHCFHDEKGG